jgi:hypothetical protein
MTTKVSWFVNWTKTGHLPKDVEGLTNAPNASRDRVAIFPANQSNPLRKGPQRGQRGHKALKGTHTNGVNAAQEEWGIHGTYETWSRAIGIPKDSLETRQEPAKHATKGR